MGTKLKFRSPLYPGYQSQIKHNSQPSPSLIKSHFTQNEIGYSYYVLFRCVSTLENDSVRFEEVFTQDQLVRCFQILLSCCAFFSYFEKVSSFLFLNPSYG